MVCTLIAASIYLFPVTFIGIKPKIYYQHTDVFTFYILVKCFQKDRAKLKSLKGRIKRSLLPRSFISCCYYKIQNYIHPISGNLIEERKIYDQHVYKDSIQQDFLEAKGKTGEKSHQARAHTLERLQDKTCLQCYNHG